MEQGARHDAGKSKERVGQDRVIESATRKRSWFERFLRLSRETKGRPPEPSERRRA